MSQTETHVGRLRKIFFEDNEVLERWCEAKCKEEGITKLSTYNQNWYEELRGESGKKYFFANNEIWEAFEHNEFEEGDDIDFITENEDGTLTFVQQFYNGGTCLSECLENAIERLNKKK